MTRQTAGAIGVCLLAELLVVGTHWDQALVFQRTLYQTLWKYAAKPADYQPPDRFQPRLR